MGCSLSLHLIIASSPALVAFFGQRARPPKCRLSSSKEREEPKRGVWCLALKKPHHHVTISAAQQWRLLNLKFPMEGRGRRCQCNPATCSGYFGCQRRQSEVGYMVLDFAPQLSLASHQTLCRWRFHSLRHWFLPFDKVKHRSQHQRRKVCRRER